MSLGFPTWLRDTPDKLSWVREKGSIVSLEGEVLKINYPTWKCSLKCLRDGTHAREKWDTKASWLAHLALESLASGPAISPPLTSASLSESGASDAYLRDHGES